MRVGGLARALALWVLGFVAAAGLGAAAAAPLEIRHHKGLDLHLIHFEGEIRSGSFKGLEKLIGEAAKRNPNGLVFLSLNSPGGVVEEALAAARLVKTRGVGTILLPGAQCVSACSFLFFSGYDATARQHRRIALAGSRLGVHSTHLRKAGPLPEGIDIGQVYEMLQKRIATLLAFLYEVQVSPGVQQWIFATPSDAVYFLKDHDYRETNVLIATPQGEFWQVDGAFSGLLPPSMRPKSRVVASADAAAPVKASFTPVTAPEPSFSGPPMADHILFPDGVRKPLALTWSREFDCMTARIPDPRSTLAKPLFRVSICAGSRGSDVSLDFGPEMFTSGGQDWTPAFKGRPTAEFGDADGRIVRFNMSASSAGASRAFLDTVFVDPAPKFSGVQRVVLKLDPVTIVLAPPADMVVATWTEGALAPRAR